MDRLLLLACAAGLLAFASSAAGAAAVSSGNFHVAGRSVGCRYVVYGPVSAGLGSTATVRCERYADHTIVSLSATGKVTSSRTGVAVKPGAIARQANWIHRYTPKVACTIEGFIGAPAVNCMYGSSSHSFTIGTGLLKIKN